MKSTLPLQICAVLSTVILSGCATLLSKSDYPVIVRSEPSEMNVVITRSDGQIVHKATTPLTVTLSASQGFILGESYLIELLRDGEVVGRTKLNSTIDWWFFANLAQFSGIRIGLGLLIDPLTGSMWALKKEVLVTDESQSNTEIKESSLKIATLDSIPDEDRKHLVKIEPEG
ncbi:MAG: hypothetical protein OXG24_11665 [Gammaproteobacteria bacterium]|nr:hypothetical protein [Gammaproteobacteria bacterium]